MSGSSDTNSGYDVKPPPFILSVAIDSNAKELINVSGFPHAFADTVRQCYQKKDETGGPGRSEL